jgi:hypothetical protein
MRWSTVPRDSAPSSGAPPPERSNCYAYRCDDWHDIAETQMTQMT